MAKLACLEEMAHLMEGLASGNGYSPTRLGAVRIIRSDAPRPRSPVVYESSVVILAQGRKRGFLGGETYRYDASNYLVLTVPLPFECETEASPEQPLLGLSIRLEPQTIAEMLLELPESVPAPSSPNDVSRGIFSTALDPAMAGATLRLLQCLSDEADARVLGPSIVREITYRVLRGRQGAALVALAGRHTHFGQIARVLRRIHSDFHSNLGVEEMAAEANMSVSAFHQHFKTVTTRSPLQYVKTTRLHKARLLMVQDGRTAAEAAGRVGYESPSQFSREFKRHFGRAPAEEAARLRSLYSDTRQFAV
jgi:AraC-like DNA-binding protein